MHLCGMDYKYFSQQCCKCNSFGCTAAIRCGNTCHGPHSDSLYSGSEHSQFNSPRLVKREAGFPNPRRALIGSNQLWRVNDSPNYREFYFWSKLSFWKVGLAIRHASQLNIYDENCIGYALRDYYHPSIQESACIDYMPITSIWKNDGFLCWTSGPIKSYQTSEKDDLAIFLIIQIFELRYDIYEHTT